MHRRLACCLAIGQLALISLQLVRAEEGMWLINQPPVKVLRERYGFEPSASWLEHVQKASVRVGGGGSGSFVSADGLVMTNHHVGHRAIEKLSTKERNLLETGFLARTREEERKCDALEIRALWTITDVTERVKTAATNDMSAAEANAARRAMMTTIESEAGKESGLDCQVVTLFKGGQYHLYCYRRYDDVRLVMAPEQAIANFGGDTDNFEYPRYDLDMCFFRVYENGQPLKPEHYFTWSESGAADGELIFVTGHPGRTQRMNTVAHLKFLRDVSFPHRLQSLWRREVKLLNFSARSDENARIATGALLGAQNSRKALTGMLAGLHDPGLFKKKMMAEERLRAAVAANPDYQAQWGDAWDRIEQSLNAYREFYDRHQASLSSELFSKAQDLVRLAEEKSKPNTERLREYRDTALDSLYPRLLSNAPIYDELEVFNLESGLSQLAETFGADDPFVVRALGGQSPRARAESLVRGTKLKDVEERKRLEAGGTSAIAASTDPLIRLAVELDPDLRAVRKRYEDEVESVEREAYDKIAAAIYNLEGSDRYPDATGTLRFSYGTVKSLNEGGRPVPPFTTLGGAFERANERKGDPMFALPPRWIEGKDKLDLSVPFNFVSTADIIGGNSGSPVLNRKGEIVGLIFDGNIHSLVLDIQYDEVLARAVAVDARGIIETLRKLYDAGALADELTRR